jgi:hypothetical protein
LKLIFAPGFSTADQVTNLSGRGVGMDVVRSNIESLRGSVQVSSTEGQGTQINIRLPLTLAIIDGFLVSVGESKFILPLESVVEVIETSSPFTQQCSVQPKLCGIARKSIASHQSAANVQYSRSSAQACKYRGGAFRHPALWNCR